MCNCYSEPNKCPNKSYSLLNYEFDFIWMQRTPLKYTDETKVLGYVKWVEIGMCGIIWHNLILGINKYINTSLIHPHVLGITAHARAIYPQKYPWCWIYLYILNVIEIIAWRMTGLFLGLDCRIVFGTLGNLIKLHYCYYISQWYPLSSLMKAYSARDSLDGSCLYLT